MSRRNIVFVDGDDAALAGMRQMLRPYRDQWNMEFFTWPERALESFATQRVDVVVSELDLPGTGGLPFLDEVRRHYPDTIRVVVSASSEQVNRLRLTGIAHRFVAKPCEADVLEWTVNRAKALRSDLNQLHLVETITNTETLPEPPTLYQRLVEELGFHDPSEARVSAIVARDEVMAARILQVVNSPYFGLRTQVSTIRQAVMLLGIDTVMALVLSSHLFGSPVLALAELEYVGALWIRSLAVGQLARAITMIDVPTRALAEEAYVAGILGSCGKLVFAANWPSEFSMVERAGGDVALERETFGADHAAVGAYLLAQWGLPDGVVEAIAYHREPSLCQPGPSPVLAAVHAAQVLEARPDALTPPEFDMGFLRRNNMRGRIGQWMAVADEVAFERQFA